MRINREDMLELTRRMTPQRSCFARIAGAYFDEEGYIDGTFNTHFLKLSPGELAGKLKIAKAIPFSETNRQLTAHTFPGKTARSKEMWQLLTGMTGEGLKNDAMPDIFYELLGEQLQADLEEAAGERAPGTAGHDIGQPLGFFLFYGTYDVPRKSTNQEYQYESEEVYSFLIGCLCPVDDDYNPDSPLWGFLFPAFSDRSTDHNQINLFEADPERPHTILTQKLLGLE